METTLLHRNIKHLGQAQGTAFTTLPISEAHGYDSSLQPILGTQTLTGANTILQKLSDDNQFNPIDDDITFKEIQKGFRSWSDDTSTSSSGRHLGHYRCLLIPDPIDQDDKATELQDSDPEPPLGERILQVYFWVMIAALRTGTSLTRWQRSSTAMIEKLPGVPRINKLRVIHLYEADYNLLLKITLWRKLVWNAHQANILNDGQAESLPGKR